MHNSENIINNTSEDNLSKDIYKFDANIQQLMHLIVHTFYSNKDIFLRELISNASDALDKLRYNSLSNNKLFDNLEINIKLNKEDKCIILTDNGIGMNKEDLLANIGTIATSGTKKFMTALENTKDMNLIGQFGVGFYSVFLVAHKVVIRTKKDDKGYIWESSGGASFYLRESDSEISKGTEISLFLNDTELEYLTEDKIKEIIKKHSQYVSYPIKLLVHKTREVELEDDIENKAEENLESEVKEDDDITENLESEVKEDDDTIENLESEVKEDDVNIENLESEVKVEDVNIENLENKSKKTITEEYSEWEQLNEQKPIWVRRSVEVQLEDYNKFYKNLTNDWENFCQHIHFNIEGNMLLKGILFIPEAAPYDLFNKKNNTSTVQLYVKRVFITNNCKEILPEWMNFVKGIVDSDDLPLTVSREMLQHNNVIKKIRKVLTKQVLKMLDNLSADEDKYNKFWQSYSKNIKLGVHEDDKNRERIAGLLKFQSTKSNNKLISLKKYIENMKEDQPGIYYITGESVDIVKNSPFLEKLKQKDYEVLYLTDPIDEYVIQQLKKYNDKDLMSATKTNLKIDKDNNELEELKKEYEPLCKRFKEVLASNVENVLISNRIVDSPCCLVTAEYGWSANMERIMKAQALGSQNSMSQYMMPKKTFELNPNHVLIKSLRQKLEINESINDLIFMTYNCAVLDSGFTLKSPHEFTQQIYKIINVGVLNIDDDKIVNEDGELKKDNDLSKNLSSENLVEDNVEELVENDEDISNSVEKSNSNNAEKIVENNEEHRTENLENSTENLGENKV